MSRRLFLVIGSIAGVLLLITVVLAGLLIAGNDDEPSSSVARAVQTAGVIASPNPSVSPAGTPSPAGTGRAYLGLSVSGAGPDRLGIFEGRGLRVSGIQEGGPAAQAGLAVGDILRSLNAEVIRSPDALRLAVESHRPGDRITITYERGDKEMRTEVTLGEAPAVPAVVATPSGTPLPAQPSIVQTLNQERLGITLAAVTPELQTRYRLQVEDGLVIVDVVPFSFADRAGVREGDVLLAIGATSLAPDASPETITAAERAFEALPPSAPTDFKLLRGSDEVFITLNLPARVEIPPLPGVPSNLRRLLESQLDVGAITEDQLKALLDVGDSLRIGRVSDVNATSLTITPAAGGDSMVIGVMGGTRVQRLVQPIAATDLRVGELVMVLTLDGGRTALAVLAYGP